MRRLIELILNIWNRLSPFSIRKLESDERRSRRLSLIIDNKPIWTRHQKTFSRCMYYRKKRSQTKRKAWR